MKKLINILVIICILSCGFAYLILFEAKFENALSWWASYTRDSQTLPYSPYKTRIENPAFLRIEEANQVKFIDKHLFWKGSGAVALPEITSSGKVVKFIMQSEGSGYSEHVEAVVTGSMSHKFKLGKVSVENGHISGVEIVQTSTWHSTPKVFWGNEKIPYSGMTQELFPNGQVMVEKRYLSGLLHGKWNTFKSNGLKVSSKEYVNGKKHGTHIFWFGDPQHPENYVYKKDGVILPGTLWMEANDKAKDKFGGDYGKVESNEYVLSLFYKGQGFQQVRLLEHWDENRRHGLFEGFDSFGNKTFKDDYKYGLRVKHRTFDKTKTKEFDRKKES